MASPKTWFEEITPDPNSSFHLMVNPRLHDFFFWHFHPELELTFIDKASGTRRVGEHIAPYQGSDLVLIGSNIPHLNFDYGVKSDYEKVVLHFKTGFLQPSLDITPELRSIQLLLQRAEHGIAFPSFLHETIGQKMKKLSGLGPFHLFQEVIEIFHLLGECGDYLLLHPQPYKNALDQKDQSRLNKVYHFIDQHYHRKIDLAEVAAISNLGREAFCRYFKKMTRLPFITFLNQHRVNQAKRGLINGQNVSEACFGCGFESLSYFNRVFRKYTGENPLNFRKKYHSGIK